MTSRTPRAISQALDFVGAPLVLEVLGDLVLGREPDPRGETHTVLVSAITQLIAVGAARSFVSGELGGAKVTPHGKTLYWRLVEIEYQATTVVPLAT